MTRCMLACDGPGCPVQVIVALNYQLVKSQRPLFAEVTGLNRTVSPRGTVVILPQFGKPALPGQT